MIRHHLAGKLFLNFKHRLPGLGEPAHPHWSKEGQTPSDIGLPNRLRLPGQAATPLSAPQHHNGVAFYIVWLPFLADNLVGIFSYILAPSARS